MQLKNYEETNHIFDCILSLYWGFKVRIGAAAVGTENHLCKFLSLEENISDRFLTVYYSIAVLLPLLQVIHHTTQYIFIEYMKQKIEQYLEQK